jgi:tetratricopeptide (TPR) repeat protein
MQTSSKRARFVEFTVLVCMLAGLFTGCMRSPEAMRDRSLAAGKRLMDKGDPRRALLEFKNAVQAMPRDAEAQYQLGNAYGATGDLGASAAAFRRATELNPKHREAEQKLTQLMTVLGDRRLVEEAERRLHTLLSASPADVTALNTLAFAELKLGKRAEAIRHLEQVLATSPQQLNSAVLLAQERLADGDVNGAEIILKRTCAQNSGSPDPFVLLGRFYSGLDKLIEAQHQFQLALQIQPQNAPALFYLGMLENAQRRKQPAEEHFKLLSTHVQRVYWPVYGMFLFQEGRKEEAVREFERLYQKDPEDRAARTRLIAVYRTVHRSADAEHLVSAALTRNPKDLNALLQRSELRLERGQRTEAQVDLNQVLHENPAMAEAHYLQARVYEKNGSTLSQRQELNECLRLNPLFLPARMSLARLLTNASAAKTALQLLDETPAEQKASLAVLVERNWTFGAIGNLEEMQKGVERGLARQRTPDLLIQDAILRLDQKDFSGARASAEEALRAAPEDVRALEVLARSFTNQNQSRAGLARLREYSSQQPQSAPIQLFLGKWLQELGDTSSARAALAKAKAADRSSSSDADLALAQLDLVEAKWQDARQKISAVLAQNSESVTARYWLAQVEEIEGNHQASIDQYRKVIMADPTNTTALNNLAFLLSEAAGLPGEALPIAQRAKELAPENAAIADTLGWILYRNGLYSLALRQLEEANSRHSTARRMSHLSMAYLKTGSVSRARQILQRAIKMEPNQLEVKQAQDLLAKSGFASAAVEE